MKQLRALVTTTLLGALLCTSLSPALACGPSYIETVFAIDGSPDIPFEEFTRGNIGVVRPKFGPKALFIAYRYANGGSFSASDQERLIQALQGKPPEETDEDAAVARWIAARRLVAGDQKLPGIYTERNFGGYNFFPNCTANAFDVAVETLNARAGTHGFADRNVHEWASGQDKVFEICSTGSALPPEPAVDAPAWLKKDRQYQIAAAHFYALNFDEARRRFEEISSDNDSVWQQTADYLVGRTLVRHASLAQGEPKKRELYEQAELRLESVSRRSGRFSSSARGLIGLIKYRTRPKERLHELAQALTLSTHDEIRQDLIDYTWLLDKFEAETIELVQKQKADKEKKEQEELRAKAAREAGAVADPVNANVSNTNTSRPSEWETRRKSVEKGEIIDIGLSYPVANQSYPSYLTLDFKPDVTDDAVIQAFEEKLERTLTNEEVAKVMESKAEALADRTRFLGANYRFSNSQTSGYEGNPYSSEQLTLDQIPPFLRVDDLSDWIFTFRSDDPAAFGYSVKKWESTKAPAWLMASLAKAKKDSPDIARLIEEGLRAGRSSPAFPTVAYHLARLQLELGKTEQARRLLDEIIGFDFASLPISTRNLYFELRMHASRDIGEFLKFTGRRPVTFALEGRYGRLRDFMETEKTYWSAENNTETKEEYARAVEESYRSLLPWDHQTAFDQRTVDLLNRHFPVDLLAQAALHPEIPDHLRNRLVLTVWTRATLLGRKDIASRFAREAITRLPEMSEVFTKYLAAPTEAQRRIEELWILIKNPQLSAYVKSGIPDRGETEVSSWEDDWWVEPSDTEYDDDYNEVPKVISRPVFITLTLSQAALNERRVITAKGSAESYLTQRVFNWAARPSKDPRLPEALYVVATINLATKYGEGDQTSRDRAVRLLKLRYPDSEWTKKALEDEY